MRPLCYLTGAFFLTCKAVIIPIVCLLVSNIAVANFGDDTIQALNWACPSSSGPNVGINAHVMLSCTESCIFGSGMLRLMLLKCCRPKSLLALISRSYLLCSIYNLDASPYR